MENKPYFLIIFGCIVVLCACQPNSPYLDQKPPDKMPQLFMPDLVNTEHIELNGVFNADLTEFFFTRIVDESFVIHHMERIDGKWSAPEPLQLFPDRSIVSTAVDMSITRDGKTMYFLGEYPIPGLDKSTEDISKSQKTDGKWQFAERVP